jgi:hypothetical protein
MSSDESLSVRQVAVAVVLLVSLGGSGVTYYLLVYQPQQAIDAAEPTNGTVVDSNVERVERSNERDRFRPNITYRYAVDGETYTNDNYISGANTELYSKPVAEDRADTFQAGRNVTIYANPDKPQQSYLLEQGPQQTDYLTVGVFGVLALWSGYRLVSSVWSGRGSDQ